MATITIDQNTDHQTMSGFEITAQMGQVEFLADYTNWANNALDAGVDSGVNRIRVEAHPGHTENSADAFSTFLQSGQNADDNGAEWDDVGNQQDNPVNDNADPNSMNASGFKWTWLDHQFDTMVEPLRSRLAARGEQLWVNICVVNFDDPGFHRSTPAEYGEFGLAVWQHIADTYQVPDSWEMWLEPDVAAGGFTGAQMSAMIGALRDRIVGAGFAKPYIIAPSTSNGQLARQLYLDIKAHSATNAGYVDEMSRHNYIALSTEQYADFLATALADGKNTSMIEWGGATHLELFRDLEEMHASAWQQYVLSWPSSDSPLEGYQLFTTGGSPGWTVTKEARTKYIEHYFRYIRRGAIMKGVTNSDNSHKGLPFMNPNGKYVAVVKHTGSGSIEIEGLPAGTYGIRYTTGNGTANPSAYDQTIADQTISEGQNVSYSMPAAGVSSVFDLDYLEPVEPPQEPDTFSGGGFSNKLLLLS